MKQRQISKQRHQLAIAALGLLVGTSVLQSCKDDDALTGQPSWLGNSIYERLEEDGQYTTMLRLIDDLGQHEVLSHTGSKTLFAANDSAFKAWFAKNNWGVSSYGQLSLAQKKLLLNNSMVNNAYLIELLSNGRPQGEDRHPAEGRTMRRETATSIFDSVQIMKPSQMPKTEVWAKFKDNGRSIPILKDATPAPMIHFLPAFMKNNKMTNEDLEILTNHQANNINEAWVNGKKVVERDITCKNGYIQKVNGVIEASPNMAEIIHQHPSMSRWAELMDRFSAPYFDADGTKEYNRLYNNQDSIYTLRYYSKVSAGGRANNSKPDGQTAPALLTFDPGWNQYISDSGERNMNYDAGAMFVPTNEALEKWWNNEGMDLQTEYGVLDSVPEGTIAKLISVNMLSELTEAIPSKFNIVLNDAKQEMGITTADIDSVFMGCNGVVYMTNRVFTPAAFAAVSYPALAHPTIMSIIYWALSAGEDGESVPMLNYQPYLVSPDATYSLLLPTNNAMSWYVDPATYGNVPQVLKFEYDPSKGASTRVRAFRYDCTIDENGNIAIDESTRKEETNTSVIRYCLRHLMEQVIFVGDVEDGYEYYKSKGGTLMRVSKTSDGRIAFAGGWQIDHNKSLPANPEDIYVKENGKSYIINDQMPLATENSVLMRLRELQKEQGDSLFMDLVNCPELLAETMKGNSKTYYAGGASQGNKNLRILDNYNYTVYVPTDASLKKLIDDGLLPTWDDYEDQTEEVWGTENAAKQAQKIISDIIVNFVRYHIQDHSIAINMAPENGRYENSFETMRRSEETGRFTPVTVNNADGQMWVMDALGNKRNVIKDKGFYNRLCREYWFNPKSESDPTPTYIYMASDVVVHQIDGALYYGNMRPWREIVIERLGK